MKHLKLKQNQKHDLKVDFPSKLIVIYYMYIYYIYIYVYIYYICRSASELAVNQDLWQ